jgi:8-oxo-dGTP pyrophosphatase MutT (NUDIX family)
MNTPLVPNNAIGALIINAKNEILLQLRDDKPDIFFPNLWGTFGGAVEPDETPETALAREMEEELGIDISTCKTKFFSEFTFDFACWGYGTVYRKFYLIDASHLALDDFTLGEGQKLGYFAVDYALSSLRLVPYDGFILWMYHARPK